MKVIGRNRCGRWLAVFCFKRRRLRPPQWRHIPPPTLSDDGLLKDGEEEDEEGEENMDEDEE